MNIGAYLTKFMEALAWRPSEAVLFVCRIVGRD